MGRELSKIIILPSGNVPENDEARLQLPPEPLVYEAGTVRGRRLLVVLVAVVTVRLQPPLEDNFEDELAAVWQTGAVAVTAKF